MKIHAVEVDGNDEANSRTPNARSVNNKDNQLDATITVYL